MRTNMILISLVLVLFFHSVFAQNNSKKTGINYTQYVNPFIGTLGTGHTFPGATVPFGLVQLTPQTGNYQWKYCSGYQHSDTIVKGFIHTALNGTGVADLGDVSILPFVGTNAEAEAGLAYSKLEEKASAGYYTTRLTAGNIKVELTATAHTGVHRYTFAKGGESHVLINISNTLFSWGDSTKSKVLDAAFTIENPTTISGFLSSQFWVGRQVYFTIQLDKPFKNTYFLDDNTKRKLVVDYVFKAGESLGMRVAISTVSIDGAKRNLQAETAGLSFQQIKQRAISEWNKYLSNITIEGTKTQKVNFYTSMYHLFIQPNNIADVDGQYRGADDKIRTSPSGSYYSTFSLWDTYRAAHPLYSILIPQKNAEFINSMLQHEQVTGALPIWTLWGKENHCMIGNHAIPIIVDAYLKGQKGIDGEKAFAAIKKSLTTNHWDKYDWSLYDKYGYLPSDTVKSEAVSRTLEACFDDWCAAQMASKLGKIEEAKFFNKRAGYYKNVFDASTHFMRGKNSDGSWVKPFDPMKINHNGTGNGDYTEANAWQYSWHVQHDVAGLMQLMGGKKSFGAKLDSLFSLDSHVYGDGLTSDVSGLVGQYAHGNEPSHHIIYLFNYAGMPYRTQELIPQILKTQYQNKPDGLCGNDDCGQMSAWYIFSSLGFYPVNPASGIFDIGVPAFRYASINVGTSKFEMKAKNLTTVNKYIQTVKLNSKVLKSYQITYAEIMKGGVLEFEMGTFPVK